MKVRTVLFILTFINLVFGYGPYGSVWPDPNNQKLDLRSVQALTFHRDRWSNGRRSAPMQQLQCTGGSAGCWYSPDAIQCYNQGSDGFDVQWKCEAELEKGVRLGKLDVSCEGYDSPDDPYVLAGSCVLFYSLEKQSDFDVHHPNRFKRSFTEWKDSWRNSWRNAWGSSWGNSWGSPRRSSWRDSWGNAWSSAWGRPYASDAGYDFGYGHRPGHSLFSWLRAAVYTIVALVVAALFLGAGAVAAVVTALLRLVFLPVTLLLRFLACFSCCCCCRPRAQPFFNPMPPFLGPQPCYNPGFTHHYYHHDHCSNDDDHRHSSGGTHTSHGYASTSRR